MLFNINNIGATVDLKAFTVTYSHPEGLGTTVLYATSPEDAETAFRRSFLESSRLVKVEPLARRRFQSSAAAGFPLLN